MQIFPSCWKANKILTEPLSVNHIPEVRERKMWSVEKVSIPAGSAKLVKVRVEGDWKGEGFVESMLPEEQESGQKLILPENANTLSSSVKAI